MAKQNQTSWFMFGLLGLSLLFWQGCGNSLTSNANSLASESRGPSDSLVVYYTFDETSGNEIADSSGNGNNAELVGQFTRVPGQKGNALELAEGGYGIRENLQGFPTGSAPRSLAFWVKLNEISPGMLIGGYGDTVACGNFQAGLDENTGVNLNYFGWGPCNSASTANISTLLGSFHHMVYTYDGTTVRMYIDGTMVAQTTQNLNTVAKTLCIGGEVSSSACVRLFNGAIDEFKIYSLTLTDDEVQTFLEPVED